MLDGKRYYAMFPDEDPVYVGLFGWSPHSQIAGPSNRSANPLSIDIDYCCSGRLPEIMRELGSSVRRRVELEREYHIPCHSK